jgi:hypothetical protein
MFAVNDSSVQALSVLNQMLAREADITEQEKNRAAGFAMEKIRSDERELTRLNELAYLPRCKPLMPSL